MGDLDGKVDAIMRVVHAQQESKVIFYLLIDENVRLRSIMK